MRNILLLKIIRIYRFGGEFIQKKQVENIIRKFYESENREARIALNLTISNWTEIFNQCFVVMLTTYVMGLMWYRLSDFILPFYFPDSASDTFVIHFGLRKPASERDVGGEMDIVD